MAWRRALATATAVCALASGCGGDADVDPSKLDVGAYSTAVRTIPEQPSPANGVALEGLRMSDAVADTSQLASPLVYLWHSEPITDSVGAAPIVGEAGARILDRLGWVTGYSAQYAAAPRPSAGAAAAGIALSISLLRFRDDVTARRAASALSVADWADFGETVAAPLPTHRELAARYLPGTGTLLLDTAIGPFVLRLKLDAPPGGIDSHVGELDAVVDEEHTLLTAFNPTPVAEIPALPRDPGGLLARMVATDPVSQPTPSPAFAVYGATGALRDQSPTMRSERLYDRWGVEALAVSGAQRLYRLRDDQAAKEMAAEFAAHPPDPEHELDGGPDVPQAQCSQSDVAEGLRYACRMVFGNVFTEVRADSASSARQMAAAQYALLATR